MGTQEASREAAFGLPMMGGTEASVPPPRPQCLRGDALFGSTWYQLPHQMKRLSIGTPRFECRA